MKHEMIHAETELGEIRVAPAPKMLKLGEEVADADICNYVSVCTLGDFVRKEPQRGYRDVFKLYERMEGLPWMRERLERDRTSANFQGNPLWPMQVLNHTPNLAMYFGLFDSTDGKRCCVPGCQAINMRLAALDESGFGTNWSFAAYQDEQPFSERAYVDAFVRNRTLPCAAEDTRDFLHDWSYHFVTLLLPRFLEGVRLNVEVLLSLAEKVQIPTIRSWNIYGHSEDEWGRIKPHTFDEALGYEDAIARRIAIEIDVLTARPAQALTELLGGRSENAQRIAQPCGLFLSPPTLASLRHVLPEIEQVIDYRRSGLAESPAAEIPFIDFAHHALAALNEGLEPLEVRRVWSVTGDTIQSLFKRIELLQK